MNYRDMMWNGSQEACAAKVREILPDLPEDEQKFLTMHIGVVLAQS